MGDLPKYTRYRGEKRIALLDNSSIEFMEKLEMAGYETDQIFADYDLILIPGWVWKEVEDSFYRKRYIDKLLQRKIDKKVY